MSEGTVQGTDASDLFRVQAKLDERGTHEFLFAERVVLCEGKDGVFAVRLYLSKLNADLNTLGVTIVDGGSVQNLPDYAALAGKLRIPWIAVTDDGATGDGCPNSKTERAREKLSNFETDRDDQANWKVNLEHCLNRRREPELADGERRTAWTG